MQCSIRQRSARWLAVALAGCGLAGCMLGPNFQRPATTEAPAYTAAPLANLEGQSGAQRLDPTLSVPAQWWSLLQSPRLDATIRQALAANRNLTAARATLEQSAELVRVNQAALYPNVALAASAGRVKYGAAFLGPEHFPPFTFYSVGPTVSYAFDYLGSAHRALEQQRSLHESQQHELDAAALSLSGQVAMQVLAAASARSQIETVDAVVTDDGTNLKLVQDAFAAGGATRVDVLNAQSQLANDQTLLPPLRRELDWPNTRSRCWSGRRRRSGAPRTSGSRSSLYPSGCRSHCPPSWRITVPISSRPRRSCTQRLPRSESPRPISIRSSACRPMRAFRRRRCATCSIPAGAVRASPVRSRRRCSTTDHCAPSSAPPSMP